MEGILASIVAKIAAIGQSFYENITLLDISPVQIVVDIGLIAILFYYLFVLIRETRAYLVLKGLIVLGFMLLVSKIFTLTGVNWLLNKLLTTLLIAIPILFQHELREGLERLGRTRRFLTAQVKEADLMLSNLVAGCVELQREKRGALIVFEGSTSLSEYTDTGVVLNAKPTKELIVSIFQHKSPLHDGAVIIRDSLIHSAACLLPHSFKNYGSIHGTRHKAALALSEITDARIILLSEERATISWIEKGKIDADITPGKLSNYLGFLLPKSRFSTKK
jgi:diadenylate cyclase